MKRIYTITAVLVIFFTSCLEMQVKDDLMKGDVHIQVYFGGSMPVKGASVYTVPPSDNGVTDEFGSVLLRDLEIGSYEVYAEYNNEASGKTVLMVKADEIVEASIHVVKGVVVGIAPQITVVLPGIPAEFTSGEAITFSIDISKPNTPPGNIKVEIKSNLDGLLYSGIPNGQGNVSFTTTKMSKGVHIVTITAEDSDGYKNTRQIEISTLAPGPITLQKPVKQNGSILLTWSEYTTGDFQKYEVYRKDFNCTEATKELIGTITDPKTVVFTDSLPPLTARTCYMVRVVNQQNNTRNSNNESIDFPAGPIFNFVPSDMLKHPAMPYVYLVDKAGLKLLKVNYETLEVVKEITLPAEPGFIDIGENGFGVEVYVPTREGHIFIYDAENLSLNSTIISGLPNRSVVINGLGHVIASMRPSPWWEDPIRTYSRSTGINIDGGGDFDEDRLRKIPGKNEIITITTSVSPVDMEYLKFTSDGRVESHVNDKYHGDYPLNAYIFRIADNGEYVITSSSGAIYLANSSMEYKGTLQRGALNFSDFAFSSDGSIIYAATSNRRSIQIGSYATLLRSGELITKGFPVFIVRDNNRIIAVSKPTENAITTGIEVININ